MVIYRVEPEFFSLLPEACFGVVIAAGVIQPEPGSTAAGEIERRLQAAIESVRTRFAGTNVKVHPDIDPYRRAFQKLGINPNKFPSSIEAMVGRVAKGGTIPSINPAVNLANVSGLANSVPIGIHDLDRCSGTIEVRMSRPGDIFTPFGTSTPENVDPNEVVYADQAEVRTRRWIWRQGEYSKATSASTRLFFPIDGFTDSNKERILRARQELSTALCDLTGAHVIEGWVDKDHPSIDTA